MSVTNILEIVETNGKGVSAYIDASRLANKIIDSDSKNSAMYFLLGVAADSFANFYDTAPLLARIAESEFQNFKGYVIQLEKAETSGSDSIILVAINSVAKQIAKHSFQSPEM